MTHVDVRCASHRRGMVNFFDSRADAKAWSHVQPCPMSGCWLWTGVSSNGYGKLTRRPRGVLWAHRFFYEALVGPIPADREIDHKCRIRCCVNPDHLEPVSHVENCRRGESPAAQHMAQTHCGYGHALTGDNVYCYVWPRTGRERRTCRECSRRRDRERCPRRRNRSSS